MDVAIVVDLVPIVGGVDPKNEKKAQMKRFDREIN